MVPFPGMLVNNLASGGVGGWNPVTEAGNTVVSGTYSEIATTSNGDIGGNRAAGGVISKIGHDTGKWYAELHVPARFDGAAGNPGPLNIDFGISPVANPNYNYDYGPSPGTGVAPGDDQSSTNVAAYDAFHLQGEWKIDVPGGWSIRNTGGVIAVAADFDNHQVWFRWDDNEWVGCRLAGNQWRDVYPCNPVTRKGGGFLPPYEDYSETGFPLNATVYYLAFQAVWTSQPQNGSMVVTLARPRLDAFTYTPPTGFSPWG